MSQATILGHPKVLRCSVFRTRVMYAFVLQAFFFQSKGNIGFGLVCIQKQGDVGFGLACVQNQGGVGFGLVCIQKQFDVGFRQAFCSEPG